MEFIIFVGVIYFMGSMAVKFLERFQQRKYGADFLVTIGSYTTFILVLVSGDILFGSLISQPDDWLLSSQIFVLPINSVGYQIQYSDQLNFYFGLVIYFTMGTLLYFFEVKGRRLVNDKHAINFTSKADSDLIFISSGGLRVLYWWHMSTALISMYLLYSFAYGYSAGSSVRTIPMRLLIIVFWVLWTVIYYFKFSDRMKEQYYAHLLSDLEKYQEIQLIIQKIDNQGEYIIKGRDVTDNLLQWISKDVFCTIGIETIEKIKLTDEIKLFFSSSFKTYYEKQKQQQNSCVKQ